MGYGSADRSRLWMVLARAGVAADIVSELRQFPNDMYVGRQGSKLGMPRLALTYGARASHRKTFRQGDILFCSAVRYVKQIEHTATLSSAQSGDFPVFLGLLGNL